MKRKIKPKKIMKMLGASRFINLKRCFYSPIDMLGWFYIQGMGIHEAETRDK
jgi:hypothetical protein